MTTSPLSESEDLEEDEAPPGPSRHPALQKAFEIGRLVLILAVLGAIAYAMVREWDGIKQTFAVLTWWSIAGAIITVVLGLLCQALTWRELLAAMGAMVRPSHAAQVNLVGQLGKYLGTGVGAMALQAQLGKQFKIPRSRALVALLLTVGFMIITALSLGVLVVRPLADQYGGWVWLLAAGPVSLLMAYPPILSWITNTGFRLMRRVPLSRTMTTSHVVKALGWSYIAWLLFGLHLWLVSGVLAHASIWGYVLSVAAVALSMAAGSIAFILPGGIGVREAIMVGALSPVATTKQAVAIALASRILFTFGDLLAAGAAWFVSWWHRRQGDEGDHHAELVH